MILDLFAGPGGWSEGLRTLDLRDVGIEWDDAACRTRKAAGHLTIRADVAAYPTEPFVGKVTGLIASPPCQDFSLAGKRAGIDGDRGQLVWQVLRWADALRPQWVACEQVPPVLPIWQHMAHTMRGWGYRTWAGVLNAADYGVPQTRKRAFLLASANTAVCPPEPSHAKEPSGDLFGGLRLPWVTMAEALGWSHGDVIRPARGEGMVERHGERPDHPADQPAPTVISKSRSWSRIGLDYHQSERAGRPPTPSDRPAGTLTGRQMEQWRWVRIGALKNATVRSTDEPAPTVLASMDNGDTRWFYDRPATTVVGSFSPDVISPPGYRTSVSRQNAEGGVRVTVTEGGVLQSFAADYPWQGSRSKQYEQVGNAVPPLLAAHVLSAVTGIALPERVAA